MCDVCFCVGRMVVFVIISDVVPLWCMRRCGPVAVAADYLLLLTCYQSRHRITISHRFIHIQTHQFFFHLPFPHRHRYRRSYDCLRYNHAWKLLPR